jgi:ppGpp synthetase/RelA/SpoT-type nucleotidyltranferase
MRKKKSFSINPEILRRQHSELLPVAQRFCTEITNQLERLLEDNGIILGFPIQHRVKTWDSISEKLTRLTLPIQDIRGLQDLIGLRIILLFKRDTSQVCNLIEKTFKVIRQYNTDERLKEDQFGYSSIHFVIELPEEWLALPTFTAFSKFRAEIQVRTVAQHIWATASHTLQYKQEKSVPATVLRSIYRVSALLETVDLEFERVLSERDRYRSELDTFASGNILNVDLLEKLLDKLLPPENKGKDEPYSELLEDLNHFGVNTSTALQKLIEEHIEHLKNQENKAVRSSHEGYSYKNYSECLEFYEDDSERLEQGVFFLHIGLVRAALEEEFGEKWTHYIRTKPDFDYDDVPF